MKKLIILLLFILFPTISYGTTWYATTSTASIDVTVWLPTGSSVACYSTVTEGTLTWASRASSDVFVANGCADISVNTNPGLGTGQNVTISTGTYGYVGGGSFVYATANNLTMNMNVDGGITGGISVSGSTNGGTIVGNVNGGTVSSKYGVYGGHTIGAILTVTGNLTGGSATNAHGMYNGTTGAVVVNGGGLISTGSSTAAGLWLAAAGSATITANCKGSDTVNTAGCTGASTGIMTITGNLYNGKRGPAVNGPAYYTPAAGNYILYPIGASATVGTIDANSVVIGPLSDTVNSSWTNSSTLTDASEIKTGEIIGSVTGTMAAGAAGGGGAWGF